MLCLVSSQGLLTPQLLGTQFTDVPESLLITFWVACFLMMPQLFCRSESLLTVCNCTKMCFEFMATTFLMSLQLVFFFWKMLITSRVFTLNVYRKAMSLVFMIFHCSLFILSMVTKFTIEIKNFEINLSEMSPQRVLTTKNFITIFVRACPVICWMCLTDVVLQVLFGGTLYSTITSFWKKKPQ